MTNTARQFGFQIRKINAWGWMLSHFALCVLCNNSYALDSLYLCSRVIGEFQEIFSPHNNRGYTFQTLDPRPGSPTVDNTWMAAMKFNYRTRNFALGKRIDFENPRHMADFYEWLVEHPNLKNSRGLDPSDPRRHPEDFKKELEYKKVYLKDSAKWHRERAEAMESDKQFGLTRVRTVLKESSDEAQRLWAIYQLSRYPSERLTENEKGLLAGFYRTVSELPPEGLPSVNLSRLENSTADKVRRSLELIKLASPERRTDLGKLALQFFQRLGRSPSESDAQRHLQEVSQFLYPELAKIASPDILLSTPELTIGWRILHTPQSTGLVKSPRSAMRSPDGTVSIAFQELDNGNVRIEGFQVKSPNARAEDFEFELDKRTGKLKETKEKNCGTCHTALIGRIDFRAKGVQNVRNLVTQARQKATGRDQNPGQITDDFPMKEANERELILRNHLSAILP